MGIDWAALFVPKTPLLELILRGSAMYLALFVLFRVVVRRHAGALSIMDLLLVVLIADAAQNGMAGEYRSLTEGAVLCATLVFWSCLLDWLAFHVPALGQILEGPPVPLVRDGRVLKKNLRHEVITMEELLSQLRLQGVDSVEQVKLAQVEPDGKISVVPFEKGNGGHRNDRGPV